MQGQNINGPRINDPIIDTLLQFSLQFSWLGRVEFAVGDVDLKGLEVLASLVSGETREAYLIVMLTGQGNEAVAVEAMKGRGQDYLVKGSLT